MTIADEDKPFIALFIPSKNRPMDALDALMGADEKADGEQDIIVVVDSAQLKDYQSAGLRSPEDIATVSVTKTGFVQPMNNAAELWIQEPLPKYIGFMGDDHRIRTKGWDSIVLSRNEAFVYGNDLWQGENLPTAVFIRADVVRALGYFVPPVLQHLYADNAWLELGRAAASIHYEPNLIIEHMHPAAGKGVMDTLKVELNSDTMFDRDRQAFDKWKNSSDFVSDVEKVKSCL